MTILQAAGTERELPAGGETEHRLQAFRADVVVGQDALALRASIGAARQRR